MRNISFPFGFGGLPKLSNSVDLGSLHNRLILELSPVDVNSSTWMSPVDVSSPVWISWRWYDFSGLELSPVDVASPVWISWRWCLLSGRPLLIDLDLSPVWGCLRSMSPLRFGALGDGVTSPVDVNSSPWMSPVDLSSSTWICLRFGAHQRWCLLIGRCQFINLNLFIID